MPHEPIRATLYGRYSTDRQRETSIPDQLRAARERAAAEGWHVVAVHADEGISGSVPVALRPGGKALLADALAGRFDVLILEGLDRLSRELGEAEQLVKRLEHRRIRIVGTADGYDSSAQGRKVMRIARGLVNELYLDDLREKTHRGLAGQFDRGYHVGGRSYGYRSEDIPGGKRLAIDEQQAVVVREIFARFADGESTRAIVHALNLRAVPGPRGGTWACSALHVSHARELGMLHNELYVGREVWNRRQWIKDPDTGKRRYVERPRAEWQSRDVPELRIVEQPTWDAVQQRIAAGLGTRIRRGKGAAPRTLLGGLMRCALCGAPMIAIDSRRYGCHSRSDRGPSVCPGVAVKRQDLERRLLAELRTELLAPSALVEMRAAVQETLAQQGREHGATAARTRLQAVEGEIVRLVDAVAAVGISAALKDRLAAAEAERDVLAAQVAVARRPPRPALGNLMARWERMLLNIRAALAEDADRERTREMLAGLLGRVTIGRDADGAAWAEIDEPGQRLLLSAGGSPMGVVAGACNPSRKRLSLP